MRRGVGPWIAYEDRIGSLQMSESGAQEILPPIDDPTAVVEWFLRSDEGVAGHMRFAAKLSPGIFWETRAEALNDLRRFDGAEALTAQASFLTRRWEAVVAEARQMMDKHGGPESVPEADEDELGRLAVSQAILAARVRILGHFLEEKYGIDPAEAEQPAGDEADPTSSDDTL